jgi:voltage-gated sodium channel
MYIGHWFWRFFSNAWSLFDLIIVALSVIDAIYVMIGGSGNGLAVMRLLRIFRIVRIFNKLEDMKRILNANLKSFSPVLNAFLLFAVIVSIYAVMAVNLFRDHPGADATFESFSLSFFTLLGIATGEEWTSFLRTLNNDDGSVSSVVAVFFVSFISLVGIVALNIIVAVLLEGFMSSMNQHDTSKRIVDEAREHHKCAGALDPLLATLANFTSPQHFKSQLDLIFCLWDVDDNGRHKSSKIQSLKSHYKVAL